MEAQVVNALEELLEPSYCADENDIWNESQKPPVAKALNYVRELYTYVEWSAMREVSQTAANACASQNASKIESMVEEKADAAAWCLPTFFMLSSP